MKRATMAIVVGTVAALPVTGWAQFTVAPAPDLCGMPCDPAQQGYWYDSPSGPQYAIPSPVYPPIGYGIAAPPHDPAFDNTGPQVVCDAVACVEY